MLVVMSILCHRRSRLHCEMALSTIVSILVLKRKVPAMHGRLQITLLYKGRTVSSKKWGSQDLQMMMNSWPKHGLNTPSSKIASKWLGRQTFCHKSGDLPCDSSLFDEKSSHGCSVFVGEAQVVDCFREGNTALSRRRNELVIFLFWLHCQ